MAAGFQAGDSIATLAGVPIRRWSDVLEKVTASAGEPLTVEVVRATGERATLQVTPILSEREDHRADGQRDHRAVVDLALLVEALPVGERVGLELTPGAAEE